MHTSQRWMNWPKPRILLCISLEENHKLIIPISQHKQCRRRMKKKNEYGHNETEKRKNVSKKKNLRESSRRNSWSLKFEYVMCVKLFIIIIDGSFHNVWDFHVNTDRFNWIANTLGYNWSNLEICSFDSFGARSRYLHISLRFFFFLVN